MVSRYDKTKGAGSHASVQLVARRGPAGAGEVWARTEWFPSNTKTASQKHARIKLAVEGDKPPTLLAARLPDHGSAAATCQPGHYPTFLRIEAPVSCMRLLDRARG